MKWNEINASVVYAVRICTVLVGVVVIEKGGVLFVGHTNI